MNRSLRRNRLVAFLAAATFESEGIKRLTVRVDVINAFDQVYQIRNGTGAGVGASQYGARRGFFAGVSQSF